MVTARQLTAFDQLSNLAQVFADLTTFNKDCMLCRPMASASADVDVDVDTATLHSDYSSTGFELPAQTGRRGAGRAAGQDTLL